METQFTLGRRDVIKAIGAAAAASWIGPRKAFSQEKDQVVNIVNTRGVATLTMQELMKRRGHLEEMGIKANILYVVDASKVMGSLISGENDVCMFSGIGTVLAAIDKGAKIRLIAGSLVKPEHAVYAKNPDIRSVTDLEGKTLGSGSTGALLHTMWIALLRKYGVDETKVSFVNVGGTPEVFRAVAAGVVDAGISEIDVYQEQEKYGVHVIKEGDLWTELPEFTFQGAYASEDAIKNKRDAIVRTLAAYAKLYRYVASPQSQQDFIDAQLNVSGGIPNPAKAQWQWTFFKDSQIYATDLVLSQERLRYMQDLNVSLGVQKRLLPYAEATDMSLAKEALSLIG
ncbi:MULTISPECIES: ABC transporter substrate-binding protein [unclassified Sinorhizobium]|uniref:ABC transporter substrate-binding protein n=1 Tax=unclassified Sinorhizobium TaxID=2613772 RepID=UPI00352649F1